jgi:hypothetical protein
MDLTAEQIDHLIEALPGCTGDRKRHAVAMILAEWARIDVERHLNLPPRHQLQAERKLLKKLATCADELAQMTSRLEPGPRFAMAYHLSKGKVGAETALLELYNCICETSRQLIELPARLEPLAAVARATAARWGPPRLRRSSVVRYLIVQDLAAILEYATRETATRRVHTDTHEDAGREYGRSGNL